ncbi:MAG TPA: hypothetical protein VNX01_04440 [Bacteroidia bacterium]|jgi:hypothetical protein|nr:hypothetical protein [Bacteroidia bacterium]
MIQLARDKNTGNLKTIYEVQSGSNCGCICSCGKDLIAKNKGKSIDKPLLPKQKNAFFAHKGDCEYSGETTMHLLAKEALKKSKKLRIYSLVEKESELITKFEIIEFDTVEIEKNYPNENVIRPDAILKKTDKNKKEKVLFVEFYVTHIIDKEKTEKIKRIAESAIEIDLNFIGFNPIKDDKPNLAEMQAFLESYPERNSKWICNIKRDDLIERKIASQEQKVIEASKAWEEKSKEYKICETKYNEIIRNNKDSYKKQDWAKKMLEQGCEPIKFDSIGFNIYVICPHVGLQNRQRQENRRVHFEDCLKCKSHHEIERNINRSFCSYKAALKQKEKIRDIILEERKESKAGSDNFSSFSFNQYKPVEEKLRELNKCEAKLKEEKSRFEKLSCIK